MYFCSEIYQRTLARLAYMTDIKDFFIASNTVRNAPDYDSIKKSFMSVIYAKRAKVL